MVGPKTIMKAGQSMPATYRFRHRTLSEIIIVTCAIYHGRDSSTFLTCPIFDFGGISSNSIQLEQRTMAFSQRDEFLMIPTLVSNITLPDKQLKKGPN